MIKWPSSEGSWFIWLLIFICLLIFVLFMRRKLRDSRTIVYKDDDEADCSPKAQEQSLPPSLKIAGAFGTFKSRIKILSRNDLQGRITSTSDFETLLLQEGCLKLNMKDLWTDTIIDEIYLTTGFRQEMSGYLDSFMGDSSGINIEIGGFLLGRYTFHSEVSVYRVIVETFIPIDSAGNHSLHLEFNTKSLSSDLGDAQDRYPDLVVVGWFHTHPGHGLFLSKADLAIQQGFFTEKFQFAMEIDSLTETFDLGFFTYQRNGGINNRQQSSNWFSWHEITATL